jgi:proteasome assembly chaperone 3
LPISILGYGNKKYESVSINSLTFRMATTTAQPQVQRAPFPAPSKTTSSIINGHLTTVTRISFSDKLLVTITPPSGKLSHWVHVPLATSANPMDPSFNSPANAAAQDPNALLPRMDLTATTVLGGTKREEEVAGQTLATTLASAILHKRPSEERMLVLGVGLQAGESGEDAEEERKEWFEEVVGLCLEVLS